MPQTIKVEDYVFLNGVGKIFWEIFGRSILKNKNFVKSNVNDATIQKLLEQAGKDGVQKIIVGAVVKRDDKFLLLERAPSEFMAGLVELPSGGMDAGENLLQTLAREVKEETNLVVIAVIAYLGAFDYVSSSGKKTRQFNFFVETKPGDIKLNPNEHSNYYLLKPSDKEFSKLNISDGIKSVLSMIEAKYKE